MLGRSLCSRGRGGSSSLATPNKDGSERLSAPTTPARPPRPASSQRLHSGDGQTARPSAGQQQQTVAVLGGEDFIYSQMSGVSEDLFKGAVLGVNADIASVDYRQSELRTLSHLPGR